MNKVIFPIEEYGAIFDAHTHLYFDFHDGLFSPIQLIKSTIHAGFNFVCAMSHDTTVGSKKTARIAKEYGLPCISAIEISTIYNHILAYGIQEWKYRRDSITPEEAIELCREQDCAVFLSHPYSSPRGIPGCYWDPPVVSRLDIDGIEWINASLYFLNQITHNVYHKFPLGRRIAGTDAHHPSTFGFAFTQVDISEPNSDELVKAMQKGKCKPYWRYPSPLLVGYGGIISIIRNKILKRRIVEGKYTKAIGDRPGSILPEEILEPLEWRQKFIKTTPKNSKTSKWINGFK
ncbi:MAG: CehA/McbA family metallohydrolase [Promethearchaeota archaeon]